MSTNSPVARVKEKIDLTEKEKMIFDRLLAAVRHFDLPIQLRVAVGWVRDKLLEKECYDIDIALDSSWVVHSWMRLPNIWHQQGKRHEVWLLSQVLQQARPVETSGNSEEAVL